MEVEKENNLQRYPLFDNKYIIIKKIDEGGFSKVYLAINKICNKNIKKRNNTKNRICLFFKRSKNIRMFMR
jgi:serine/threonine protein kinase